MTITLEKTYECDVDGCDEKILSHVNNRVVAEDHELDAWAHEDIIQQVHEETGYARVDLCPKHAKILSILHNALLAGDVHGGINEEDLEAVALLDESGKTIGGE